MNSLIKIENIFYSILEMNENNILSSEDHPLFL